MTDEYRLPIRATVDTAHEIHTLAMNALAQEGETGRLALDASEVETVDGPTVLILANMAKTFAARDAKISVKSPTSAFVDSFSDLGVFEDLMKMEFVS